MNVVDSMVMKLQDDEPFTLFLNGVWLKISGKGRLVALQEGDRIGWGGTMLNVVRIGNELGFEGNEEDLERIRRE